MGLVEIFGAMEEAAAAEEQRQLTDARAAAESALATAREQVASARLRVLAEADAAVRDSRARLTADARLRAASVMARARETLLYEVFDDAERALAMARAEPDYPAVLERLLRDCVAELPGSASLVARCDPRDVQALTQMMVRLSAEIDVDGSLSTLGGVVVQDQDGRIVADNTLERRLERARETLQPAVARLIGLLQTSC